jgi:hypothetical protein
VERCRDFEILVPGLHRHRFDKCSIDANRHSLDRIAIDLPDLANTIEGRRRLCRRGSLGGSIQESTWRASNEIRTHLENAGGCTVFGRDLGRGVG